MKIGIVQLNPTVGDIAGNAALILQAYRDTEKEKCDLVLFSELVLTGYPPEDLLFKPNFIDDNIATTKRLASSMRGPIAVVGYVEKNLTPNELIKSAPGKTDYVKKIVSMVDRNEYKRRQQAPGIKITPRAFGRDHRMPITNRYIPTFNVDKGGE